MGQNNKSALVISYLFPPLGGIGVHRPLKFVKYLNEYGWNSTVLTVRDAYSATTDPSLLSGVPENVQVVRVSDPISRLIGRMIPNSSDEKTSVSEPSRSQWWKQIARKYLKKLKDVLFVPDEAIFWALSAVWVGRKLVSENKIDCIYTTSGPNSCHITGLLIHFLTGVKWVADFRDPWIDNQHFHFSGLRRWFEGWLEKLVFRHADSIVTVTTCFKTLFENKYPQIKGNVYLIRNGVDPEDFPVPINHPFVSKRFTIFYAGILYPTRSPHTFLQALSRLIRYSRIDPTEICVQFAGVFDYPGKSENRELVKTLGLEHVVEVLGYLSHEEAIARMMTADALLLIGESTSNASIYVPGKLYEYFYAQKPILALLKEGEAADLIREMNAGIVVTPLNPPLIADAILRLYQLHRTHGVFATVEHNREKYSRKDQTRQLADVMQKCLSS